MTAIEYRGKIVVIDCGLEFPRDEMLGIDLVLPDIRWLLERRDDVLAFLITHGHEDHIGALPFVLQAAERAGVRQPAHAGARQVQARRARPASSPSTLNEVGDDDVAQTRRRSGPHFVAVSHSVPDALAIVLEHAGLGTIVVTGRLQVRPHAHRRPHHRRQHARPARAGRACSRCWPTRPTPSPQGSHRLREPGRAGVPPDLRRGRGPRHRGLLRLAHPPRAAGHADRPPARAQVRRLRALDEQERQHRPQPRLPAGARRRA